MLRLFVPLTSFPACLFLFAPLKALVGDPTVVETAAGQAVLVPDLGEK